VVDLSVYATEEELVALMGQSLFATRGVPAWTVSSAAMAGARAIRGSGPAARPSPDLLDFSELVRSAAQMMDLQES
jgi:hypothetical protein